MQTFLPYPNFSNSAASLDRQRLGKQRVECSQILTSLRTVPGGVPAGWMNHPAVLMWRGYESALAVYFNICVDEWEKRGYNNFMVLPYSEEWTRNPGYPGELADKARDAVLPPWIGDEEFHASHRAALLFKDPEHYGRFGWTEAPALDYKWPVRKGK